MTRDVQTSLETQITITELDGVGLLSYLLHLKGHRADVISGPDLQSFAEWLRTFAPAGGKPVQWGRDYLDNVLKRRPGFAPSGKLTQAIMAAIQAHQGTPLVWAQARPITVSVTGNVTPGALLDGGSRDCATCFRPFIPHSWNDLCCSSECDKVRDDRKREAKQHAQSANGRAG